jgi:uncharacterized membrane protein YebE (DUF533 family)
LAANTRAVINRTLRGSTLQARVLIDQALAQPLDPQRLAEGIVDPQEALEIYSILASRSWASILARS